MREFEDAFVTYGFPKIYNNITDVEDILNMFRRDIFTNRKLSEKNMNKHAVRKIPV
jgi:hypothetical protein